MNKNIKNKSEEYWKQKLTPEQYEIVRLKKTEAPFTGKLINNKETGMYTCVACGQELFSSKAKYDSNSGWPSFYDAVNKNKIELIKDSSHGLKRTEVLCSNCGAHLGHLFKDGPIDKTGLRYCINSTSLKFIKKEN